MLNSAALQKIVQSIIQHQELVIGPLALEQARKVSGLAVSTSGDIQLDTKKTDGKVLLEGLVHRYEELFGQTSVEVCKDAVKEAHVTVSDKDLPEILK